MIKKITLEIFAKHFIKAPYQYRCVHDGLKKPDKLMNKACHHISELFHSALKNSKPSFTPHETCYFFDITGNVQKTTWEDAIDIITHSGGGGNLIINQKGNKFYAESEGEPPPEKYAGFVNDA
ncbi:MAG: hypothetical protein CR975_03145 [Gammaproteobacteria bacterium]|nr:MAG: hypothetical protein CR975_03145 [Gammaproteobacteria bacterium]